MVEGRDQREVRGHPAFANQVRTAVAEVVHKQADIGIDVLTDGEMSKVAFSAYVTERVTGFDGPLRPLAPQIEPRLFPEYY
jgi:5-methyltetrahydropteroyltriglutamate--homocysteine methyltransferase